MSDVPCAPATVPGAARVRRTVCSFFGGWLCPGGSGSTCPRLNCLPPSPQPPSPPGKGEFLVYFAGGFAPGTPTSVPGAARHTGRQAVPEGGLRPASPGLPCSQCPVGGAPRPRRLLPLVQLFHPSPDPLPRWGRGRLLLFLQGASPLASPRLRRERHGIPDGLRHALFGG